MCQLPIRNHFVDISKNIGGIIAVTPLNSVLINQVEHNKFSYLQTKLDLNIK